MAGATYDVVSGIASNSTEYTTAASYSELHNITLATGDGVTFLKASWDARMNFTAPLYGRFMRDGESLGRFNLTQSVYAQVGSYEIAFNESTGTHYYGFEVYSNKKGTIYSRNFSAVFLKNGSYGSGAGGGNVSSVTGAPAGTLDCTGTDDIICTITAPSTWTTTYNSTYANTTSTVAGNLANWNATYNATYDSHSVLIITLQNNDTADRTYVNTTFLPILTYSGNFPNTTIANLNGNYPNSSLVNYLLISSYAGNFPNSSLVNYLLTSAFGTNFNTSFHAEIPVCNATTGKLVSDDGETVTCGTDQTGAAGGNVSSVTAQSPLTYTGTTDVTIKDERTTYPNNTIASKEAIWDTVTSKTTLTVVNSSAQITETQVTNLISDLSGKEPAISSSTASKFYGWDKTFKDILISYISGLQEILDTHNSTTSIVNGNLVNWNATYNSSYHTLLTNAPNNTVADNLANWNATYNATYDLKLNNVSAGSNVTITWSGCPSACVAQISSSGGTGGGITLNEVNQYADLYNQNAANLTGTINYSVIPALPQANVSGLVSDLAGKEPTITGSTSNTFWNGLKQWITLGVGNITGLQEIEDTQNSSITGLQSNDTQDRAFVNTTFMKVVNATICTGTDKNIWNGSWWNCDTDQNTGTSTGGGINVSGQPVITANASLVQGTNITLTQSGTNITIASTMGFTTISTEQFTASGTEQNYTLSVNYLVNSTRVYVNGLRQPLNFTAGSYSESVATKSINFTSSPRNGDKIEIEYAQS
jgi:hypothetical protein